MLIPLSNSSNNSKNPTIVIEANNRWSALDLREFWHYRDLLYILMLRDIKVRYKQTILGAAWAIIQPLLTMVIFLIFFGKLNEFKTDKVPYALLVYAGLVPWIFFANAVSNSGNSLIINSNLITKVYFPRIIIPVAAVASGLIDLAIAFILLLLMMLYYGIGISANFLMLPVLLVLISLLATGFGLWVAALNVKYRDIRYALPFVIQLGIFASGIISPIPENWQWLKIINPVAVLIEAFRAACFDLKFDWIYLGVATAVTLVVLFFSTYQFRKLEDNFADVI